MKKVIALILGMICIFALVGCGVQEVEKETTVYTFSGENEYIRVTNGTAVIGGEEETFSGGNLEMLNEKTGEDAVSREEEFYVFSNGEERILMKNVVNDPEGGASVSMNGDLGKISGANVISEYKASDLQDFENNLFFRLTLTDSKGKEKSYELKLNVEKVN